jgi:hypothetical protein
MNTFYGYVLAEKVKAEPAKGGIMLPSPSNQAELYKVFVGNSSVQAGQYILVKPSGQRATLIPCSDQTTHGNARVFVAWADVLATVGEKEVA